MGSHSIVVFNTYLLLALTSRCQLFSLA